MTSSSSSSSPLQYETPAIVYHSAVAVIIMYIMRSKLCIETSGPKDRKCKVLVFLASYRTAHVKLNSGRVVSNSPYLSATHLTHKLVTKSALKSRKWQLIGIRANDTAFHFQPQRTINPLCGQQTYYSLSRLCENV